MAVGHKPSLVSEAFRKLHIKDKMTRDLLTSNSILGVAITRLESNSAVFHLPFDCIFPEVVTVLLVCFQSSLPRLGNAKPMFVCPLEMFGLHLVDDGLPLLADKWWPPSKGWLFLGVVQNGMISGLDRTGFF